MLIKFLTVSTFLAILNTVYSLTFTVYDEADPTSSSTVLWWGGGGGISKNFTVNEGACMNFHFYNDKISSIDTYGGCVKVWEHKRCSGASLIITDRSGCSKNLAACDVSNNGKRVTWDKRISSVSTCSKAEENKANRPIDNGDLVEYDMLLVNSNNAKTTSGDLQVNNLLLVTYRNNYYFVVKLCKHVDCKRQERILVQAVKASCANFGEDWDRQVSAVYTLYDCVEMFDGKNCTGESIKFSKGFHGFLGQQRESCTLNLSRCGWNDRIRSMRNCAN